MGLKINFMNGKKYFKGHTKRCQSLVILTVTGIKEGLTL
jgi:hypothetical protein